MQLTIQARTMLIDALESSVLTSMPRQLTLAANEIRQGRLAESGGELDAAGEVWRLAV